MEEYLLFNVDEMRYAVAGDMITKVVELEEVRRVPRSPAVIRGIIRVDDNFTPLCDLRSSLGLISLEDELFHLQRQLQVIRGDHIAWLEKVKEAVYNDRPLEVEEDPHKCRFGKWYDSFYSSNFDIRSYMARFAKPHQKIHQLAHEVRLLLAHDQRHEARALIQQREDKEFSALLALIDNAERNCRRFVHEYAMVVDHPLYGRKAVSIDGFSDFKPVLKKKISGRQVGEQGFVDGVVAVDDGDEMEDVLVFSLDQYFKWIESFC